jgi:hypothetical protein
MPEDSPIYVDGQIVTPPPTEPDLPMTAEVAQELFQLDPNIRSAAEAGLAWVDAELAAPPAAEPLDEKPLQRFDEQLAALRKQAELDGAALGEDFDGPLLDKKLAAARLEKLDRLPGIYKAGREAEAEFVRQATPRVTVTPEIAATVRLFSDLLREAHPI